jgi:hypothetical protein
VDTNTGSFSGRRERNPYECTVKDENSILINRLRAIYLRRAVQGDLWTQLSTEFSVRKLRNGLFRLGIWTKELDEKIKEEAAILAVEKSREMLQESLLERATLYEMAGPAHQMIQARIKGLLKNLEKLGSPLSTEEFNRLRDDANVKVCQLAQKELADVVEKARTAPDPYLQQKAGLLKKLLQRIASETNLRS